MEVVGVVVLVVVVVVVVVVVGATVVTAAPPAPFHTGGPLTLNVAGVKRAGRASMLKYKLGSLPTQNPGPGMAILALAGGRAVPLPVTVICAHSG